MRKSLKQARSNISNNVNNNKTQKFNASSQEPKNSGIIVPEFISEEKNPK